MPSAPDAAHAAAATVFAAVPQLSAHRVQTFALRLDHWWDDLDAGLRGAYPDAVADALALRIVTLTAMAYVERDDDLAALDEARTLRADWFQRPEMLGYAAYVDRFGGTLTGVVDRLPYLRELGVTYLHLMPLLQPRPGDSDGGYAVADYRTVREDLGTIDDLRGLARRLRAEGISLVLDLVLNHVAREHAWAQAARDGDQRYRDYFYVYPDRTEPDAYEAALPEVFPDTAPGNFTWDTELDAWVWTTFNTFQWDVNWANPDVFAEYADIVLYLANAGVEVFRLDAIAFTWKRLGTSCQNQPEVHALTQALRAVARIACPAVAFKAEAIVGPNELMAYLGRGEHHGRVSDLAYHNSLMVQVWSMLASGEVRLAVHALRRLMPRPATTAWVTYLRCHDDIGWAVDDGDAAAVGLGGGPHRAFLSDWYSGQFKGSPARGQVFQYNEETGDRRISGSAADLCGVGTGLDVELKTGKSADLDRAVARLLLGHAVVLGWGGIPVLWMGDELGLLGDPHWADDPTHAADNRWAHRPRMPWDTAQRRHDRQVVAGRVYAGLRRIIDARAGLPQLHAATDPQLLDLLDPGVFAVLRPHPIGPLLELFNVTPDWRPWPAWRLHELGLPPLAEELDAPGPHTVDVLTGTAVTVGGDGNVWLPPYAAWWLVQRLPA
ncbi:MAG: alpha-amylase family protein [Angustibacter sp.]